MPKLSNSQKSKLFTAFSLLLLTLLASIFNFPLEEENVLGIDTENTKYTVVDVVDGDTVKIRIASETYTVRLIGVDTPETVHPNKDVECYGKEASDELKQLLEGESVYIDFDESQDEQDRYGRLLLYIWRAKDDLFINEHMISDGFAYEYTYNTSYYYQPEFKFAETAARNLSKGLWGSACN